MDKRAFPFVVIAPLLMGAAQPARSPDGYHCSVETFTNIAAIHGVGVGEVTLSADPEFRPTGVTYSYSVRDRMSGYGRMVATWALGVQGGPIGPISSVWLPFHFGLAQPPATVWVSLDEAPPVATAISDPSWLQLDTHGRANGLRLSARAGAAPELHGRRSFGYQVKSADGATLVSDFFLMPNWKKVPGAIRSALGRAKSLLRKKKCDPFFRIGRPATGG